MKQNFKIFLFWSSWHFKASSRKIIRLPLIKGMPIILLFNFYKHWRFILNEWLHQLSTICYERQILPFHYTVSEYSLAQNESFIPSFDICTLPITVCKQFVICLSQISFNQCPYISSFSSVQLHSCVWLFETPWITACQASLSITNSRNLPKLMPIESVMPSNHLIFCRPLLILPSIFPSIRIFSNESALCITWPEYWSFSFNLSPCNEHGGLNSFRMGWLYLLAVQVTLKSLPQHHSSKASILQRSAFFTVQFSWSIPKMFSFFFRELLKIFPTYFWTIDSQKLKTYSAFSNKACMKLTTEGHEKVLQWWNYAISWLS